MPIPESKFNTPLYQILSHIDDAIDPFIQRAVQNAKNKVKPEDIEFDPLAFMEEAPEETDAPVEESSEVTAGDVPTSTLIDAASKTAAYKIKAKDMLVNPDAFGSTMLLILVGEFGTEFFTWDPDTLALEVMSKWKVIMPERNRDKVWALVTYLTTNSFMRSVDAFIHICNSLSGEGADFKTYSLPTPTEIGWGITECFSFEPPDGEFDEEIKTFISETLKLYGHHRVPKLLAPFVNMPIDTADINETLSSDGIDYNAFWDSQQRKNLELDQSLVKRLVAMVRQIASAEIQGADPKAVHTLLTRAETTLGDIEQSRQQVQETVKPSPSL
jgi:hypothetical protein